MKVIHIVESLDKGAVETWLVEVFLESRKIRPEIEWTFFCYLNKPGRWDKKVLENSGKIIFSPFSISQKWKFLSNLRGILRKGKYDIIHSHHDYLSGFYLIATTGIKFEKRILHIHNTDKILPVGSVRLQNMLLKPFRALALFFSDLVLGISKDTLNDFRANYPLAKPKFDLLYYGINLNSKIKDLNREEFLSHLNIPVNAKVLIFVGRLSPLKNPMFALRIMSEIRKETKEVYLLVVGKGDLEEEMKDYLSINNLVSHVKMLGWQENIISLMRICDLFIFPRIELPKEGLGFTVLEAQLSGIPVLISKGIVEETYVIKNQIYILGIDEGISNWKDKILEILAKRNMMDVETAKSYFSKSVFDLQRSTVNLLNYYS